MKKTSFFLLVLTVLLTLASCNQKEKKLAKIVDGITAEQLDAIREITAEAFGMDADSIDFGYGFSNDTLYFVGYDNHCYEGYDFNLRKEFILAALCSDASETKGLLSQISEVPAALEFFFVDTIGHSLYNPTVSNAEIKGALSKNYTSRDALSSYVNFVKDKQDITLENDYVVLSVNKNGLFNGIEETVQQDIDDAKNSFLANIDDIVDINLYKDKISESYIKNFQNNAKETIVEIGLFEDVGYFGKLMKNNDVGFIVRFKDSDKNIDIVWEPDELKQLIK